MAYDGTYLSIDVFGGKSNKQVAALDTVDSAALIGGANYLTDGIARGLQLGDIVIVTQKASLPNGAATGVSVYAVSAVTATACTIIKTATA